MEVTLFTPDIIPSDQPCWLPWMSKSFFFFFFFLAVLIRTENELSSVDALARAWTDQKQDMLLQNLQMHKCFLMFESALWQLELFHHVVAEVRLPISNPTASHSTLKLPVGINLALLPVNFAFTLQFGSTCPGGIVPGAAWAAGFEDPEAPVALALARLPHGERLVGAPCQIHTNPFHSVLHRKPDAGISCLPSCMVARHG